MQQANLVVSSPSAELATTIAEGIAGVSTVSVEGGEIVVRTSRDELLNVMTKLRDKSKFLCEQLIDLCGVDFPERTERFDVVYNLLSVSLNHRVRVIVTASEVTSVPSVSNIWPCATWWERECWDLYGVTFSGLADHRRILTDYGFEGHPLRKDFPLTGYVEVRYDEDRKQVIYEPVRLTQDFRDFHFLSPWEGMTTLPGDEKTHTARMSLAMDHAAGQVTKS